MSAPIPFKPAEAELVPVEDVVRELERHLAEAKAGRLRGYILAGYLSSGAYVESYSLGVGADIFGLVGSLEVAKKVFIEDNMQPWSDRHSEE